MIPPLARQLNHSLHTSGGGEPKLFILRNPQVNPLALPEALRTAYLHNIIRFSHFVFTSPHRGGFFVLFRERCEFFKSRVIFISVNRC